MQQREHLHAARPGPMSVVGVILQFAGEDIKPATGQATVLPSRLSKRELPAQSTVDRESPWVGGPRWNQRSHEAMEAQHRLKPLFRQQPVEETSLGLAQAGWPSIGDRPRSSGSSAGKPAGPGSLRKG